MSTNGVNNQNLQSIYDNLIKLSNELGVAQASAEETLFEKKDETVEDGIVLTNAVKPHEEIDSEATVGLLSSLVNVLTNLVSVLAGTNKTEETKQSNTESSANSNAETSNQMTANDNAEPESAKSKYGTPVAMKITKDNFDAEITNSSGTTYLVINGYTGSLCNKGISGQALAEKLDGVANVAQMTVSQLMGASNGKAIINSDAALKAKAKEIFQKVGCDEAYPRVIKFVDGEPVEVVSGKAEDLIAKAEGTPEKTKAREVEEYAKKIKCGYMPYTNPQQINKNLEQRGFDEGTTYVLYNCPLTVAHCGSSVKDMEAVTNNLPELNEAMYDMSEENGLNFLYMPSTYRCINNPLTGKGMQGPLLMKYVNGVPTEVVKMGAEDVTADGLKKLVASMGMPQSEGSQSSESSSTQSVSVNTEEIIQKTVNSFLEQFTSKLMEMFTSKTDKEDTVALTQYEIELLQKGIPLAIIKQGDSAIQEYAKINNIEL